MNFSEARVRRRLMNTFIDLSTIGESGKPELVIEFIRPVWEKTEAGGIARTGELVLPAQVFAPMPLKRRQTDEGGWTNPGSGKDGVSVVPYILICDIDVDIQKLDYFVWYGEDWFRPGTWEVDYVSGRHYDRKQVGINFNAPLDA
jgi:hypothetical protein